MEQYLEYFEGLKVFKAKKDIVQDIESTFGDEISYHMYQKIIGHYIESGVIQEISEKRKRFYLSTKEIEEKGSTIQDLFAEEKLGITTNKALAKAKNINFDNYLKPDAVEVVQNVTDLFNEL